MARRGKANIVFSDDFIRISTVFDSTIWLSPIKRGVSPVEDFIEIDKFSAAN
jgi:hypothetical protein